MQNDEVRLGLSFLADGRYIHYKIHTSVHYKIHTLQRIYDTAAETSPIAIKISSRLRLDASCRTSTGVAMPRSRNTNCWSNDVEKRH